uniref:Isochorismatase domain containing 2 n=1 Tax=Pelodiscus sinensis TaxID=13735 RepID=K7GAN0_PELSI
ESLLKPSLEMWCPGGLGRLLMSQLFRAGLCWFPKVTGLSWRVPQAARLLEIPVVVTEQYPQGLGPTVPELGAEGLKKFSKTCFSMLGPEVERELGALPHLRSVLLCGIETQACIMVPSVPPAAAALRRRNPPCPVEPASACLGLVQKQRPRGQDVGTVHLPGISYSALSFQIQKLIKEPAPDSGLLPLFLGQSPGFS